MIDGLISKCKAIFEQSGLVCISRNFLKFEEANLIGNTPEEILELPLRVLESCNYKESVFIIYRLGNRKKLKELWHVFPNWFWGCPLTFSQAKYIDEIICNRFLDMTKQENIEALDFLSTCYEEKQYWGYRLYLSRRDLLKGCIDLPVKIERTTYNETTYDWAELYIEIVSQRKRNLL